MSLIARNIATRTYIHEIYGLLSPSAGFHFNVAHAAPSHFSAFSSMKMASTFEEMCPAVWKLFGALLNAVAIQNEANSANNQGNYLMELTYRNKTDKPTLPKTDSAVTEVVVEVANDMPDEDWGMYSEEDSPEEEYATFGPNTVQSHLTWSAQTGAPWHKAKGRALRRQIERTYVVS
ncbi:hypothetical protein FRC06_010525 [Ceratobasidium sp. 370]|nr:hypothetical protein FRC06_010525 [Ceratobasidium sp. 370]